MYPSQFPYAIALLYGLLAGVYTAPHPQTRKYPQSRRNYPQNQPPKFWYVPEVYKMTKVLEDGIENGKKSVLHLDFLYVNLKIFTDFLAFFENFRV